MFGNSTPVYERACFVLYRDVAHIFLATVFAVLLMFSASLGYGFEQKGGDCMKCHTLDKKDAEAVLKGLQAPDPKILDIRMSSVKGLWEVSGQIKGMPFLVYVDFAKKYVTPGPFMETTTGLNVTRQRLSELERARRVDFSRIPLENALLLGKNSAPVRVVVFTDPD